MIGKQNVLNIVCKIEWFIEFAYSLKKTFVKNWTPWRTSQLFYNSCNGHNWLFVNILYGKLYCRFFVASLLIVFCHFWLPCQSIIFQYWGVCGLYIVEKIHAYLHTYILGRPRHFGCVQYLSNSAQSDVWLFEITLK
jgi:hypothetical protein